MSAVAGQRPGSVWRLVVDIVRGKPVQAGLLFLTTTAGTLRIGVEFAAIGGITQGLIDRNQRQTLLWVAVFVAITVLEQLYWPCRNLLRAIVLDHALHRIQGRVLNHAASAPLIAFEQGSFFTRLQRATDNLGGRISSIFMYLNSMLEVVFGTFGVLVPVWFIDPWIVVILLIGTIPGFIAEYNTAEVVHRARIRNAPGDQLMQRVGQILTDRNAAAEIRLFGNGLDLIRRWMGARNARGTDMIAAERTKARAMTFGSVPASACTAAVLVLAVQRLLTGDAPIGAWPVILLTVDYMSGMGFFISSAVRQLREDSIFLGDLFAFEDEFATRWAAGADLGDRVSAGEPSPAAVGMRISARNVSFSYPDSDRPVLEDVSLDLAPGERVALVGENGAGKSTLVRLLTGLYEPTAGTVTLDDVPTSDDAIQPLMGQIGAVFQDFVPWQMSLRDNVALGNLDRRDRNDDVYLAARQAGIADLIDELPDGLDTWLGREFGERDLSGGQWQRVAIARAFFRDARFLVLDEPTAALDPLAEQRIFERFGELAAGRTALMISHRLGPARFADRILLLSAGRIIESGTHDELMEAGGRYAAMFRAQAEWYNSSGHDRATVSTTPGSAP